MSSFLKSPYSANLDWQALDTLIEGGEPATHAKAITHLIDFGCGQFFGEPQPLTIGGAAICEHEWCDEEIDKAKPLTREEVAGFAQAEAEGRLLAGGLTTALLLWRVFKTIKQYAPDAFALLRSIIKR